MSPKRLSKPTAPPLSLAGLLCLRTVRVRVALSPPCQRGAPSLPSLQEPVEGFTSPLMSVSGRLSP